jgi:hypothetical protein
VTTPSPSQGEGSPIRLLIGIVLITVALTTTVIGFLRLIRLLEGGGYGTPAMRGAAMRGALGVLGGAGALFAAGIATVIWDIAKRYENK